MSSGKNTMTRDITMPRLSDTMSEGTLLRWLKRPGDEIRKGDAIAEVETDKATMDVEAFETGTLGELLVEEGQSVPVGQPIARLDDQGASPATRQETQPETNISEDGPHKLTDLTKWGGQPSQRSQETVLPPSRRREQRQEREQPHHDEREEKERLHASPRARKIASDHGIDLRQVPGSGPGGRIVDADVQSFIKETPQQPPTEKPPEESSKIRRTIARRMTLSKQEIPHFYLTSVVRADGLTRLRKKLQTQFDLSFNDLIVKACAMALRRHSLLNSRYEDEQIHRNDEININMAVAIPGGLITPVIHHADERSLEEIARESREVIGRARADALRSEDLTGGTFTISNMGMYKLESFTAIINPPQSAILAVGPIRAVPVVENGVVIPGYEMRLTLSADHRVANGAEAAGLLATITHLLENPVLLSETELVRTS